jgi:endonuclease YncB( thermonuclease family)
MKIFSFLLLFIPFQVFGIFGKVIGVHDGDTFTLLDENHVQYKIRLHGIDCPELKQAYGKAAKQFASDLIFGRDLYVETTSKDRYGRWIGIVKLPGNTSLNEELLKAGLAWHYTKYDQNPIWAKWEIEARKNKIGLWQESNQIAPWTYRKM